MVLFILSYSGCDLPRDNPLDPDAYNYQITSEVPVLSVNSYRMWEWFPLGPDYFLQMKVEGQIAPEADSVFANINGSNLSLYKSENIWYLSLESYNVPGQNLFNLIGWPFSATVYYDNGKQINTKETFLIRVIEERPVQLNPKVEEIIEEQPIQFEWFPVELPFNFTLEIAVFVLPPGEGPKYEVARVSDISSSDTTVTLSETLLPNDHTWTITIIDDFNNASNSGERNFTVIQ